MLKRYVVPFLYCGLFPLLIGFTLFVLPEFSSFNERTTSFARLIRTLVTLWLMLSYVVTGISFIPNLEASPIALFNTWGKYYRFRDENHQPRFDRSLFPVIYFFSILVSCVFASLVLWIAISTFAELSPSVNLMIAVVNFALLFLPQVVLYNQAVRVLYGDEPF